MFMSSSVSIRDVARAAGVSKSTVSRVLAGKGKENRIPPATQARVRIAAIQLGYQPNLIARDMALGKGVSLTRSAESAVSGQTASAEPEPTPVAATPAIEPAGEIPTPVEPEPATEPAEEMPTPAEPPVDPPPIVEEIPAPTPEPVITTPPTPEPVVVADPVVVESPSLPPVMAVPEPVAVVVPVEPEVVMEPVVMEPAVPLPAPVPVAVPEQEPEPVTPPVVVVEPVLASEPASHHPETPHPGPLPQGAREAETLATPIVAKPVAPEPAIAPEVQEQASGVMQPETVTAPVSAVETPVAEMADGTATQPP
jgi:transcriptional regulator with XRE-family HTH domain